jgi:hypothetical protein
MLDLSNIVLLSISSNRINETQKAIEICTQQCSFKEILFFTDTPHLITNKQISGIYIDKLNSIKDYDYFVLKKLPYYLSGRSNFYLTIHWDGFIVNPDAWTDEFLNYDYIGAAWPWYYFMCGNGGFCLKSQKFIDTQLKIINDLDTTLPDDVSLCIQARQKFIEHNCLYAPPEIAYQFSTEYGDYNQFHSFGFHDFQYHPQFKKHIILYE